MVRYKLLICISKLFVSLISSLSARIKIDTKNDWLWWGYQQDDNLVFSALHFTRIINFFYQVLQFYEWLLTNYLINTTHLLYIKDIVYQPIYRVVCESRTAGGRLGHFTQDKTWEHDFLQWLCVMWWGEGKSTFFAADMDRWLPFETINISFQLITHHCRWCVIVWLINLTNWLPVNIIFSHVLLYEKEKSFIWVNAWE